MSFQLNLETETVNQVDGATPICVAANTTVRAVIHAMRQSDVGSVLVVCEEGTLCGIFTERDALKMMAVAADFDIPVEEVMTKQPESIGPAETIGSAIKNMAEGGYRQLPLVNDQNEPTAVLKAAHILRHLVDHFPEYVYNLPPTPHHTTQEREGA